MASFLHKQMEVGGCMGGDCTGSDLVKLSAGFDFVNGVIDAALEPYLPERKA